jgi:hypothetical protein
MAKDPAFLFYPGDYLRDTQCLSEKTQVAYDRIMCEHMRNICISQDQINFFTKRLTEEEKSQLMFLLIKVEGGFQIEWVAASISKRRSYSESRRENRIGKTIKNKKTYDSHMENEIENENVSVFKRGSGGKMKGVRIDESLMSVEFSDGTSQPLGDFQKQQLKRGNISAKLIEKGIIE